MSEKSIATLLLSETARIQHPVKLDESYTFPNADELVEVLLAFLRFRCGEPLVERVGDRTLTALSAFAEPAPDFTTLPDALQTLANGFDSFLKKIAVVKYGEDPIKLRGDGLHYEGLLHMQLHGLLLGRVKNLSKGAPALYAPIVTYVEKGMDLQTSIYEHVRLLRNEVHEAPHRSRLEILRHFQIVTAGYFFAVAENMALLRDKTDPLFIYLKDTQASFQRWEHGYVELLSEGRGGGDTSTWSDLRVFEWREQRDADPEEDSELEERDVSEAQAPPTFSVAITDVASSHDRFWLIGEPGGGKSTTLQRLAWGAAKEILATGYYQSKPCPVLIDAKQFTRDHAFLTLVADRVKEEVEQVNKWLKEGRLWLLIDGLNEVAASEQEHAYNDLGHLLQRFNRLRLIVSSRSYDFHDRLALPVFELLPFTDAQIKDYLERHTLSALMSSTLFQHLAEGKERFLDLARNPFMLNMLVRVSQEGALPPNKGAIFSVFVNQIFQREEYKGRRFKSALKKKALMALAFHIRQNGMTSLPQADALRSLQEAVAQWHPHADLSDVFDELLESHLLEIDTSGRVKFFHELALEYFVTLDLQNRYQAAPDELHVYYHEQVWFEPLLMLSHILEDANDLVRRIAQENLMLAAKCVASWARVTQSARAALVEAAAVALTQDDESNERQTALTALLELATDESLRLVIQALADEPTSYNLTGALVVCERPERAVLGLLQCGLLEKEHIYQCLRVFRRRALSSATLDHSLFAQAERALLEERIDDRYLAVISDIGISKGVEEQVHLVVRSVLETGDPASKLWRNAISLASHHRFIEKCRAIIEDRVYHYDGLDGHAYYGFFVACVALPEPVSSRLVIYATRKCLQSGLPALAAKFIRAFHLQEAVETDVLDHIAMLANNGRIGPLLELTALYSHVDFEEMLSTAVGSAIVNAKFEILYQHHASLSSALQVRSQAIQEKLIEEFFLAHLNWETLNRYIKAFALQVHFSSYGIVSTVSERKYGFITNLVTREKIFFHFSKVTNLQHVGTIKPQDLVLYRDQLSSRRPDRREALHVTIVRDRKQRS